MPRHPNHLKPPRNSTPAFEEGWVACETGRAATDNPYAPASVCTLPRPAYDAWAAGFEARADRGFRVDHLPRTPSGAFA